MTETDNICGWTHLVEWEKQLTNDIVKEGSRVGEWFRKALTCTWWSRACRQAGRPGQTLANLLAFLFLFFFFFYFFFFLILHNLALLYFLTYPFWSHVSAPSSSSVCCTPGLHLAHSFNHCHSFPSPSTFPFFPAPLPSPLALFSNSGCGPDLEHTPPFLPPSSHFQADWSPYWSHSISTSSPLFPISFF